MWTGLSAWLAHHLRVMKLPHLLRDTKELLRMVKIDIKEFYMSGFLVTRLLGALL